MDYGPLVKEKLRTGEEFVRRFDQFYPVKIAFWLMRTQDEGERFLHVVSDQIDESNKREARRRAWEIVREMKDIDLDTDTVRILDSNDPRVVAALDWYRNFPHLIPTRLRGSLGKISIEDGYLYPLLHELEPAPAS